MPLSTLKQNFEKPNSPSFKVWDAHLLDWILEKTFLCMSEIVEGRGQPWRVSTDVWNIKEIIIRLLL